MDTARSSDFSWRDWRTDARLGPCSYAAKGLWMDMLAECAGNANFGYLEAGGRAIVDSKDVANLLGAANPAEIALLLEELEEHGVFSRDRRGCIFCRRMVREAKNGVQYDLFGASPKLELSPPHMPFLAEEEVAAPPSSLLPPPAPPTPPPTPPQPASFTRVTKRQIIGHLRPNWQPDEDARRLGRALGFDDAQIDREVPLFVWHWTKVEPKKTNEPGWNRTWANWLKKTAQIDSRRNAWANGGNRQQETKRHTQELLSKLKEISGGKK